MPPKSGDRRPVPVEQPSGCLPFRYLSCRLFQQSRILSQRLVQSVRDDLMTFGIGMKVPVVPMQCPFIITVKNPRQIYDLKTSFGSQAQVVGRLLFSERSEVRQIQKNRDDGMVATILGDLLNLR